MADVSFIRGTTSGISETPLVDGQLLVDTDKKDILLDVEDSSTHDVERLSMNSIPAGGAAGQVLKKASAADRDVTWGNAASGGGHTIVDGTGTSMADESNLQFVGLSVTDDPTNGRTVVSASGLMDKATYTDANDRIPLTKGGTGASSASGARTNLGLGSAATKSSTTSVTSGGTGLPTSGAVYSAINTAKNDRMAKDGSNADSMVKFSNLTVGSNYSRTSGNNCIMAGEDISASGEYSLAQGSGIGMMSSTVSCELSDTLNIGDSIIYISIPDAYIGYPCYIPYLDRYGYSVYAHMGSSSEIVLSESSGKSYPDGDPLDVQFYATTSATAYCSQAFGYNSSAGGKYAHAEGEHSRAAREAAHAEGKETISSGEAAHAEGSSTTASGAWSHSEGRQSIASGQVSHAEGSSTQAKGNYSHTEGESTIAYDYGNHAEGVDTVAGDSTSISATAAHAEGQNTRATHSCSHAEGFHTQTGRANQHVQGSYNVGRSNTLFEIGNGDTEDSRSNVFEVYSDGNVVEGVGTSIIDSVDVPDIFESVLPYYFGQGSSVIYNNKIHILGSYGGHNTKHYAYSGNSWVEKSILPYSFYSSSAVVYNNQIHILGSAITSCTSKHYSYDGTNWVEESTLPYPFYRGSAVVYNNKIHILGGANDINTTYPTKHYSYDGTSWTEESTLPYKFDYSSAVVYNDKIHILGSYIAGATTNHYSYDGTNWVEESTLPYPFYRGSAVVYDNKIHILGGRNGNTTKHYSYDGASWTEESTLPYEFYEGSAVVYDNKIHILGGTANGNGFKHYSVAVTISASINGSHVEGHNTVASGDTKHVLGRYNVNNYGTLFEIGNGTADNARSNALEVYEDGNVVLNNGSSDKYVFHIGNTAASTAVAYCNKVAKFYAADRAAESTAFTFSVTIKCGDYLKFMSFDNKPAITSISLYDAATSKQTVASANFTYTAEVNSNKEIVLTFTIAAAFVSSTVETALNAVIDSKSPGFACVYAANDLNLTGIIQGRGIVDQFNGFADAFNTLPVPHTTQHVGDFYFPTGGPRWNLEIEVDPGTAYYAVCYLENTTTGAYFNHSICYVGVPVPTIAAPTVAPAPVAGKVVAFVGTTWTPFVAGVAGVVTGGAVTTKPRLRIQGYHASNTPTAGLGMHLRLFRIY